MKKKVNIYQTKEYEQELNLTNLLSSYDVALNKGKSIFKVKILNKYYLGKWKIAGTNI